MPQTDAVSLFREIERSLASAYMRGDRAFVDRLLTDDWTVIDYLGQVRTKRDGRWRIAASHGTQVQ